MKSIISFFMSLLFVITGNVAYLEPEVSVSGAGLYGMKVVAHRGGNALAPENSLTAFKTSVQKGYYASECDIMLTKDNQWVVTHDNETEKHFWGVGRISKMTLEQARKLKYLPGAYGTKFDEPIATFEEYLDVFRYSKTRPQIELKTEDIDHLDDVVKAIEKRGMTKKVIIISFHLESLKKIAQLNKNIEIWYVVDEITQQIVDDARSIKSCTTLTAKYKENDANTISLALKAGLKVAVWTVDDIETAKQYYDMGATYVVTNKLVK